MDDRETIVEFAYRFERSSRDDPNRYMEHRWAEELLKTLGLELEPVDA